ncbi:hypothetical protein F5Y06DRAFT_104188 [Hypoxylon sp. FL0890]|nr:hypothetical protein F5Y06DRAFT_104188 [Hypoxylon sp. FL0890]
MAPHKGQLKPGKAASGHAKKQSAAAASSRPIVLPAIPLPLIPKSKESNKRPPTTSSANGFPASSLEAALAGHGDNVAVPDGTKSLQRPKVSRHEVNGSSVEKAEYATNSPDTSNGAPNGDHDKNSNSPAPANGANGTPNGLHRTSIPSVAHAAPLESGAGSGSPSASANEDSQGNAQFQSFQSTYSQAEDRILYLIGARESVPHALQSRSNSSSTLPSNQHPPFQHSHAPTHPLQHQLSTDQIPDQLSDHANLRGPPPHMHHYQHHPHMSNGGAVVFGAFGGSHTPSPVPPPGGFMPPPPPPMPVNGENGIHSRPNGRHSHSGSNSFPGPINTQFRPDMLPMSSIDTYGQVPASGPQPPFDPFSPGVGRYGLETPHSFHGSHASGELNGVENGALPPYPPNGFPYGGHTHHDRPPGRPHLGAFPPFLHLEPFARYPDLGDEGLRDSIIYFQDQFDRRELADCTLELVSTKRLHHPLKINGHKLIFARSSALKQHIMAARANDLGSHTITIESDDSYLRSDAWWSAVRRLYLFPLPTPAMMDNGAYGLHFADDKTDRFEFSLGYAAAGHLLNMHDVFMRGLQMAADFLTWNTVEEALAFVFEGTVQRHIDYDNDQNVELEYAYGAEVRLLQEAIRTFIINAFPGGFEFDPSVADPSKFARIPADAAILTSPPTQNASPTIARGTNMRNPGQSNRLSSIKFGDLPPAYPEDGAAPPRGPDDSSPILSRILLNLPFNELRKVLTSQNDGAPGMHTAQVRYHAIAEVIAEREARRLRAVEAVRAGAIPNSQEIQQRLSAQRRYAIVEPWDVLNWQEVVIQPRGAEVPRIVRTWVPQFAVTPEAPQQQMQPQSFNTRDSMV